MYAARYGYGSAGAGLAKLLSFLCPMLLLVQALALTVRLPPHLVRYLWMGLICVLVLSAVVALALLLIGPWRNRLAGAWLGVVAGGVYWLAGPVNAWAVHFSRYF